MKGKLLLANGGTLFLDEIGDMPFALQTRLLRVLAEREILPLGAEKPIAIDVNIISATHQNLTDLISNKSFREDLYYRLNGATLNLPPLRQRSDQYYLIKRIFAMEAKGQFNLAPEVISVLLTYQWPGNIRQLISVARYALAVSDDNQIKLDCLPKEICEPAVNHSADKYSGVLHEYENITEPSVMMCTNGKALLDTLRKHKWNISAVSHELDSSRSTIYRKMERYNIKKPNTLY